MINYWGAMGHLQSLAESEPWTRSVCDWYTAGNGAIVSIRKQMNLWHRTTFYKRRLIKMQFLSNSGVSKELFKLF